MVLKKATASFAELKLFLFLLSSFSTFLIIFISLGLIARSSDTGDFPLIAIFCMTIFKTVEVSSPLFVRILFTRSFTS